MFRVVPTADRWRLKAYLVTPSLFNCNHFHLSSVTKPKSAACQFAFTAIDKDEQQVGALHNLEQLKPLSQS